MPEVWKIKISGIFHIFWKPHKGSLFLSSFPYWAHIFTFYFGYFFLHPTYLPEIILPSWGFSASEGISHPSFAFFAPSILPLLQYPWILRSDISHRLDASLTEMYPILSSSNIANRFHYCVCILYYYCILPLESVNVFFSFLLKTFSHISRSKRTP